MRPASFIVVADRGSLRAYRVDETVTRGPNLQLVQAFDIPDVSDRSSGGRTSPMTDWPQLEAESERRICQQLADQIAKIVEAERVEGWSFAAPASIYTAIVDLLPVEIRERIVEHVRSDLVKTEASKLPEHFRSLRPA